MSSKLNVTKETKAMKAMKVRKVTKAWFSSMIYEQTQILFIKSDYIQMSSAKISTLSHFKRQMSL